VQKAAAEIRSLHSSGKSLSRQLQAALAAVTAADLRIAQLKLTNDCEFKAEELEQQLTEARANVARYMSGTSSLSDLSCVLSVLCASHDTLH
jgi:hypothetical protein